MMRSTNITDNHYDSFKFVGPSALHGVRPIKYVWTSQFRHANFLSFTQRTSLLCQITTMMKRLAILGVLAALATIGSAVPISGCKTTHRVSSGEKCSSIATIWKLTVTQLESINPSLNCNALQLHELVCVQATLPSTSSAAVSTSQGSSTCLEKYTLCGISNLPSLILVSKSYTGYNIAKNSSLTLAELQHLNPKVNCTILQIGAKLCVKSGPTTSSTTSTSTLTSTSTHTGSASTPTSFGCTKLVAVGEEDT
ncbi:hypothetical protein BC937DRAFT_91229, partial [Endogone sp. FLAS-F59071]